MSNTAVSDISPENRQANWREVHFAALIIFIMTTPLSAAFFVYSRQNMFIYAAALATVGFILSATESRWLTVTLAAGVLSPLLGFITLTEVMILIAPHIRL